MSAASQDQTRQDPAPREAVAPRAGRRWAALGRAALQLAVSALLIFGAIGVVRYLVATKPTLDRQAQTEPTYAIEITQGRVETIRPSFEVFGAVEARRSVELRALVAGEIIEVNPNMSVGDVIPKGALLIQIDPFAYEGAVVEAQANLAETRAQLAENEARLSNEKADLMRAREQLVLAERDLKRAEDLVARGAGTPRTLDERRLTLSQRRQAAEGAANALVTRTAQIDRLRAVSDRYEWRLRQARRDLRDTKLRAPFDAVVRSESVEVGRRLGVNDVVAALYEKDALDVRFTVSDRQFGRLQSEPQGVIGREAAVRWAIGDTPIEASGVVDRIGSDVSATRGGVELIARIDASEPSAKRLKPGAVVTVTMPDQAYVDAARTPETALFNGAHVFTVETDADGADRLTRRAVTALAWDGSDVILKPVEAGWLEGARIMTSRLAEAGDGVRVRIIEREQTVSR